MDFNSILIGSEDPERLVDVLHQAVRRRRRCRDGGYTGWQLGVGLGDRRSARPRSRARTPHPGRIIWNIETPDVAGDFDRFKAAGAIVVAEPYGFDGDEPGASIATFADPDDNYFQLMTPMEPSTT